MPGGDDDVLDEIPESYIEQTTDVNDIDHAEFIVDGGVKSKFTALYEDAFHRNMRQKHIYSKCIDKECTFKPQLITKKSKLSKQMVNEVRTRVI